MRRRWDSLLANVRNRHLLAWDALFLTGSPLIAYALWFEGFAWAPEHTYTALIYTSVLVPLKLAIFYAYGLYRQLWRHASTPELRKIVEASAVAGVTGAAFGILVMANVGLTAVRLPISVALLDAFFTMGAVAAPRLLIKIGANPRRRDSQETKRALIAGAGNAGELVLKELRANPQLGLEPVGFVDDDRSKHHYRLGDLPVFGSLAEIPEVTKRQKIQEIIIAMPQASGAVVRNVLNAAVAAHVPTRIVPGLSAIIAGRVRVPALREVEIQDLLRREPPLHTDLDSVRAIVTGRSVLVTGAGGSVGSEIARQIAQLDPAELLLLDNRANKIYQIANELSERHPNLVLLPMIIEVREVGRLRRVFDAYRPLTVLHGAAHKRVPLMEDNVAEATTNNVLGTMNVVRCAVEAGTERLVFISTDEAVRPTSVVGATKRAAEMVVQEAGVRQGRKFVSVRSGNLFGSRGSVVPTFLRQIQKGGPITITHPEMRRYFMTIPETVQLVLQAGAIGCGGETFVLRMGDPVKIVDLAADLIRLSGLEVGKDIAIRYTGLRKGERLQEEVFMAGEDVVATEHTGILRTREMPIPTDFDRNLEALIAAARSGARTGQELKQMLSTVVLDYNPSAEDAVSTGEVESNDSSAKSG